MIKKTTLGDQEKPYCKMGDWAVVHYKAFVEGKLTENSRTYEKGFPRVLRLGYFQATKCWDIALQQLRSGDAATVTCPGYLDKG